MSWDAVTERVWGVFLFAAGIATGLVVFVCCRGRLDPEVKLRSPWLISLQLVFGIAWVSTLYLDWQQYNIYNILDDISFWCRMLWLLMATLQMERLLAFNFQKSWRHLFVAFFLFTQFLHTMLVHLLPADKHLATLELLEQDLLVVQTLVYVALLVAIEQLLPDLAFYRPTAILDSFSIVCYIILQTLHQQDVAFVASCFAVVLTILSQVARLCGSRVTERSKSIYFWNKLHKLGGEIVFGDIMDCDIAREHFLNECSKRDARGRNLVACLLDIEARRRSRCCLQRRAHRIIDQYTDSSSKEYINVGHDESKLEPAELFTVGNEDDVPLVADKPTTMPNSLHDVLERLAHFQLDEKSSLLSLETYVRDQLQKEYFNWYLSVYSGNLS